MAGRGGETGRSNGTMDGGTMDGEGMMRSSASSRVLRQEETAAWKELVFSLLHRRTVKDI